MHIRALNKSDFPRIAEYLAHRELAGLTGLPGDRGIPMSVDEISDGIEKWRTNEHGFTRLVEVDGDVVGHVKCEWWWDAMAPWLDVVVRPDRRNQGLGTGACRWMLRHLFTNTPAHVVHVSTPDWNEQGVRFAERLGFERAGEMRRIAIRDGRYVNGVEFEMLRSRWEGFDAADR